MKNNSTIAQHILLGRIGQAIVLLESNIDTEKHYQLMEQLIELKSIHRSMLAYLQRGVVDEQQEQTLAYLKRSLLSISDALDREDLITTKGKYYARRSSIVEARKSFSIEPLLEELAMPDFKETQRDGYDRLVNLLFESIWVAATLPEEAQQRIRESSEYLRLVAASAMALSFMFYWDITKLRFVLEEIAQSDINNHYRVRLAVCLVIAQHSFPERWKLYQPEIAQELEKAFSLPANQEAMSEVLFSQVRSALTATIMEVVSPIIENKVGDLYRKFQDKELEDLDSSPLNELLKEEMDDSFPLKQLIEVQQDGIDTMYTTFNRFKDDYFFQDLAAWFLPFDPKHSRIAAILNDNETLRTSLPILADQVNDADLYSFLLTTESNQRLHVMIPPEALEVIRNQMGDINALYQKDSIALAARKYMQQFYRFALHFPMHEEFPNLFEHYPLLTYNSSLLQYINGEEIYTRCAQFMYRYKDYKGAIAPLKTLRSAHENDPDFLLQLGNCYYRVGDWHNALENFQRADLIEDAPIKVHLAMAECYRNLNLTEKALALYDELLQVHPNNTDLLFVVAFRYFRAGAYKQALAALQKYEFTAPDGEERVAPLMAKTFMALGDHERAVGYHKVHLNSKQLKAKDLCYYAYSLVALKQYNEALLQLQEAAQKASSPYDIIHTITEDIKTLRAWGISVKTLFFLADGALQLLPKKGADEE